MSNNKFEDDEALHLGKTCLGAHPGSTCFQLDDLAVLHMPVEGIVD
jgi:hypothetical protein